MWGVYKDFFFPGKQIYFSQIHIIIHKLFEVYRNSLITFEQITVRKQELDYTHWSK